MNSSAHVVVIGAGVVGCSAAYFLAKRGVDCTVVERAPGLCYGASGASQAGCNFFYESPVLNRLAQESARLYRTLSDEIGYDIGFTIESRITCGITEEQIPYLQKRVIQLEKNGLEARLLNGDEIRKLEPSIGQNVIIGLENKSGTVNPFKLNYGLGRAAKNLGVNFLFNADVTGIELDQSKVNALITNRGKIKTEYVVNAAGAWASEIGKMVDIEIPIRPRRGQIIVTEPVRLNQTWRRIVDAHFLTTVLSTTQNKTDNPWLRLGVAGALYQDFSGNWTIGASHDYPGYDTSLTLETLKYIAKRAIEFLPYLKSINCIRMFAGLRSFCSADGMPIIGKAEKFPSMLFASGHAGYGIALAPVTGKVISELITEGCSLLALEDFSVDRFQKN
jgi:sarcosine oxidase subunit beta